MASQGKLTIRVGSSRGASSVSFTSVGQYVSTPVSGYAVVLNGQPIQPTTDTKTFWLSVLALVQAEIESEPSP
jgi:hypothetical protein